MIGQVFGEWTVLARGLRKTPSRETYFLCQCSCGVVSEVRKYFLKTGKSTRCAACGRATAGVTRTLPDNQGKKNAALLAYKRHACERNIPWALSDREFFDLVSRHCIYCRRQATPLNGVDRMDNSLGYTSGNSVPCCSRCNSWKSDLTLEEFKEHARRVAGF